MADGFADIVEDHRSVDRLLEQYFSDPDDGVAREVCEEIAYHSAAEEVAVYPHLRRLGPGEEAGAGATAGDGIELAERAELEHADVGAQIARVLASPPPDLGEPMARIATQVRAHIDFEEHEILPRLRALLDAEELARAFADAKESVRSRAGEPMY